MQNKQNFYNFLFDYLTNTFKVSETRVASLLSVVFYKKYELVFTHNINTPFYLESYDFFKKNLDAYTLKTRDIEKDVSEFLIEKSNEDFNTVAAVISFAVATLETL